jgi:hypothetical protein
VIGAVAGTPEAAVCAKADTEKVVNISMLAIIEIAKLSMASSLLNILVVMRTP